MGNTQKVGEYGSLAWTCRRLHSGPDVVQRLARTGHIGVLKIPGSPAKFRVADVERIRAEGTTPAKAEAELIPA